MRINNQFSRIYTACFICMGLLAPIVNTAQIRTNWFDVNPSTSNTDAQNANGSSGGRVNHVASSSDLSRMYAATEWGGLYTSFNQGVSWVRINTFVPAATWDVKVDPTTSGRTIRVYATSFYDGRVNSPRIRRSFSGISISNDGGNTWRNAPLTTLNCTRASRAIEPSAWQIAIHPTNPNTVFVGTNCGLAITTDAGVNWNYVDPSGGLAEQIYAVMASGNNTVDVIGDNGHFRSTDGGGTWTAVNTLPGSFGPGQHSLAMSPNDNNVLFATTGVVPAGGVNPFPSIFESDDGGVTWPSSITIPAANAQGRIPFVKTNQRIASNQFDLWYGDVSLFRTTGTVPGAAGGVRVPANPAWTNVQNGGHNDVADVMFNPQATADACPLLFANDGGVYRNLSINSPNCMTPLWEQPNVTPHATWLFGFDGVAQGVPLLHGIYYGMQDNGLFGTIGALEGPSGAVPAWNNADCCDGGSHAAQSNTIAYIQGAYSPGRSFRLFRKDANYGGGGFGEIPNYPSTGNFAAFKSGRELVRIGNNAYAITLSDGVYVTNNMSATPISWTSLNAPGGSTAGNVGHIKSATVRAATSIYYHTGSGNPNGAGQIFRRASDGSSGWIPLVLPAGITGVTVYDVDPNNGNSLIICGINAANNFSMWRTTDYGGNWTQLNALDALMTGNGVFQNVNFNAPTNFTAFGGSWQPSMVEFSQLNGNTVVAGATDAGVFLTTDLGNNWRLISNPNNPTSTSPHIPRPLFAYFTPTRFTANSQAFDIWIGTQGAGVRKVLVESP
ncbi:MAG TPA: sialidase family protein [Chitinophagaceae bacterium]